MTLKTATELTSYLCRALKLDDPAARAEAASAVRLHCRRGVDYVPGNYELERLARTIWWEVHPSEPWPFGPRDADAQACAIRRGAVSAHCRDLQELRYEAGVVDDRLTVAACDLALEGDEDALAECLQILAEAQA